ncbi:hypothetical protein MPSEU_001045400 [Mayamaea pseudoterrestris]|nr:hypothetical protein MPSEU_001045400 [Mayamaea pseudoterrestris]
MTIVANISSQEDQDPSSSVAMSSLEIESPRDAESQPKGATYNESIKQDEIRSKNDFATSPSESLAVPSGEAAAADEKEGAAYLQDANTITEPSTEVVLEKPLARKRITTVNLLIAILVPLALALIIALIAISHKKSSEQAIVSQSSSFDLTGQITCGCSTCTTSVLSRTTDDQGTTCLEAITNLMGRLGLDEPQACMLVGQEFPAVCGSCDASVCNRRVGNCGCPSTCTNNVLATLVTDDAGAYSCRDRMQYKMDTTGMDEGSACDFVSSEFPAVCGRGCKASECQAADVPEAQPAAQPEDKPVVQPEEVVYDAGDDDETDDEQGVMAAADDDVCPSLMWQDEFNGNAVDTANWGYQNGDGCDIGLCGWGNAEWQKYQSENAVVSDGKLTIEARNDNGVYTSARLSSKGLKDFRYGYVEASIQIPQGNGMWPAFWALSTDESYGKWPQSGEIDVMENVGREAGVVHGTIHYGDLWPNNSNTGTQIQLPNDDTFYSQYHNYAVYWEEDRIRWFLDGAQYSEKTPDDTDPHNWPFNERFYLLLNLAVGGNWPGSPDSSTVFPQQMNVDFVRIYNKPFGRLTGPTVVDQAESGVVFTLESDLSDYTYEWTVPRGATITSSNPSTSSSITVSFGRRSGYVIVVATSTKCKATKKFTMPVLVGAEYQYVAGATVTDCGCPNSCTDAILDSVTSDANGDFSCRERINWVMTNRFVVEEAACKAVYNEFPSACTCDPSNCA